MTNTTVKEFIAILEKFDPNAIMCRHEADKETGGFFSSLEVCYESFNVSYIDDGGDEKIGNVVAIY